MTATYPAAKDDPATPMGAIYAEYPPMSRVVFPSGCEGWLVTRYEDVRLIFSDTRFSRNLLAPGAPCLIEPGDFSTGEHSILNMDPPDHTRLRKLTAQAFTVRRIAGLRPRIQEIADTLLRAMAGHGPPVDLVEMFAFPLPTAVMCEILGVPFEGRERFRQWSRVIVTPMAYSPAEVAQARRDGADDMAELVAVKRETPGEDLLSVLVHARDEDGDRLTEAELIDLATQLLLAGHETTVSLIATGIVLLAGHPDQLAALRSDPSLTEGAVEEIMRFDGPADASLLRVALDDVELSAGRVRRGEAVLAHTGAANRDEAAFPGASRFDIRRRNAPQLGFGHGLHFCLGAALARLEGEIAFRTLLDGLPGLDLAVPASAIAWRPPLSIRGPEAVPVTWATTKRG
ncbi:cytochrome P450 [Amycolatopsis sp. EV170708-02-1]|uniref:cytochrome P450 n=1 Tax=Amycolatopsis sp. EV170708-02-1 TaxID=2919322 RepID=UPI001F0C86BC|nr:cytochrome P450 [Amycolatopsis sp. EV170708-02-1]UMP01128.1 cytochrome P450 [Amycolatopsis sp. EV170708-02-1]